MSEHPTLGNNDAGTDPGQEIFRQEDDQGQVVVYRQGTRLILTLGSRAEQSMVNLQDPSRLEHAYTQAMALALLFVAQTRDALLLGLGGGALVPALRAQCPAARIHGVEQRAAVIQAALACFGLTDDPLLTLTEADANRFVRDCSSPMDLIFADLYGPDGMDACQTGQAFLGQCRDLLTPDGVFVANLWGSEYRISATANQQLRDAFDGRVLFNHVQGGNIIAYGFAGALPRLDPKRFFQQAQRLGLAMRIPLQKSARNLWRQNAQVLKMGRYAGMSGGFTTANTVST